MPRKTVYVSNQSPKDLMAGLLDIVQNQGGDNHLTVSCMRAMNKYLTTNLRQSKARIYSHDSKRSTPRHICRICGKNLADMANCAPDASQNVNDSHECEPMEVDEQPRTEIPQVGLVAPVANATATQPADEEYPSTEGSDEASNDVPQIISVAPAPKEISGQPADEGYPTTESSDEAAPDTPSKTVFKAGKKSASDPIRKVQTSSIRKVNSSPLSKASLIRKLTFSPIRKFVSRAIAETESAHDETPSGPPRSVDQTFSAPEGSGSDTEPEDDLDVTPFLPRSNVNQPIVIPDDIESDATDEESSPPPHNPQIRGSPTRFGGPQNVNMSFMVHNDTSSDSPSPPGARLGSSPPVMSNIPRTPVPNRGSFRGAPITSRGSFRGTPVPSRASYRNTPYPNRGSFRTSPAPQNRSSRDTPATTSFCQPDFPSDGSDADTEDDAEKDVRNATEKYTPEDANKKAEPAGYRTFLKLIKGSLGQPFNPDETLTSSELGTSSPCVRENDKAKESNEDVERVEETDEDTDEETNYDEDLIARSLITGGPNPTYVNPRPITPPRPATPIILPDITLTNTETNREQTIDFENAGDDPDCGIEYRKLEAVVTRADKKFLRVPRTDLLPKATRQVPSRRPLASWQQGGKRQPGPSNLKRPRDDERTPEPRKKIKFAFGSTEKDGEWSRTKSGPRIWFKDGMKYYDDPEVNPNAKPYKYNERPGMIQVQRTPQKSKAEKGSGTNSNKSDSENERE